MLSLLSKPILTSFGISGGLVVGGSSLAVGMKSNNNQNVEIAKDFEDIGEEKIQPAAPVIQAMPEYQFGMLYEQEDLTKPDGIIPFKCQLESETVKEDCALFKAVELDQKHKKWIGIGEFKNQKPDPNIASKFASDTEAIYKVNVKNSLITKWQAKTTDKLKVFAADASATTPLTTIFIKGLVKTNDSYRGNMQYIFAEATALTTVVPNKDTSLEVGTKTFKCDFPGGAAEYEDCEIYHFFEEEVVGGPNTNKKMRSTLTKSNTVVKKLHYLIKFVQPLTVEKSTYVPTSRNLKINVFTDQERTVAPTTGVKTMTFLYKFSTTIFGKDNHVDFAVVI